MAKFAQYLPFVHVRITQMCMRNGYTLANWMTSLTASVIPSRIFDRRSKVKDNISLLIENL